jgi:hypothetical protein
MKNVILTPLEAEDLRVQAEKVLRGLGNPEPPIDLQSVYELLRLDRQFYSSTDDGAVREFVSRVKVAGRQIVARPTLLIDVIRKAQLSALWVPDRKRILIDSDTPELKWRWYGAHEVGHSLIPWHEDYLYGDSEETLTPMCDEQLESEANYTAGQLLFMLDRFTRDALDLATSLKSVRQLSKRFGNTITSTLWRFVEEAHHGLPLVGIVTPDPFKVDNLAPTSHHPRQYCIESAEFKRQFANVSEPYLISIVNSYISHRRGGPLGDAEIVLTDSRCQDHVFYFETWSNGYSFLTLGQYKHTRHSVINISARTTR